MFVGEGGGDAAAGGAVEEAELHEVRFVDFLDGVFFLAERSGEGVQAHGAAGILLDDGEEQVAVDVVEAVLVNAEHGQCVAGHGQIDEPFGADFGEIAHAAQQAIGDARGAAAAAGNFGAAGFVHADAQDFRGTIDDQQQIFRRIKFQAMNDAEARAQRGHDQPGAGGGADQGEAIQLVGMHARAGPLADDQVDAKILHGGIEDFFHGGLQAMNFIEEEKILGVERSKDGGEVALLFEQRAGTDFYGRAHFVGENLGKGGFAQAGRTVEQHVIEGLAAGAGGFDGDLQIFFDAILTDVIGEFGGADAGFDARVVIEGAAGNYAFVRIYFFWHLRWLTFRMIRRSQSAARFRSGRRRHGRALRILWRIEHALSHGKQRRPNDRWSDSVADYRSRARAWYPESRRCGETAPPNRRTRNKLYRNQEFCPGAP